MSNNKYIITIDGPAGAGKSTVSTALAKRLGIMYLDTGAMYRSVTFKAMSLNIDPFTEEKLLDVAEDSSFDLKQVSVKEGHEIVLLFDGEPLSDQIRTPEVTAKVSQVASYPKIRAVMVDWQRRLADNWSLVVEGRDAGSVIFPNAEYKFYLDANLDVRTQRRYNEWQNKGVSTDKAELQNNLKDRDHQDQTRDVAPLTCPDDAHVIDSSQMTIDDVADYIIRYIEQTTGSDLKSSESGKGNESS